MAKSKSRKFGELPDNCGVDYEETCDEFGVEQQYEEYMGESCEEDDFECFNRRRPSMASGAKSRLSTNANRSKLAIDGQVDGVQKKPSIRVPSGPGPTTGPPFEGLPGDYYKKKYRPDYPDDLKMKKICAPKPPSKKSVGPVRTHAKAVFVPSDPSLATLQKRGSATKVVDPNAYLSEASPLETNRMPPPIISASDEIIVDWLEEHNVQMMFEYFLALCAIHQPDDPWVYISELCQKMMDARANIQNFEDLPRILTPDHSEAIFRIYDRIGNGFITMAQYKCALEAMGLNQFSLSPHGWEQNQINKDTFVSEATDAINNLLRSFMSFEGDSFFQEDQGVKPEEELTPQSVPDVRKSLEQTEPSIGNASRSSIGSGSKAGAYNDLNLF